MRGVNSCFQLANFAGLLFITFTKGNDQPGGGIYAVEIWIVLSLCIGGVFSARTVDQDDKPPTFIAHEMSFIGRLIELGLTAAVTYYSIWFIYIGMDAMQAPPCSHYAFFFAKVDLYHWFRTMQKVFFTIAAVLCSILLMFTFASFITCTRASGFRKTLGHIFGFQPDGTDDEVDNGRMPPEKTKLTLRSVNLSSTAFIFFIVSTELVIKWNHIEGVHNMGSTGQLLPVVIGGGSFIRVLWRFLVKIINGDYRTSFISFIQVLACLSSEL
ncbi:hypothetical protein FRC02_011507 [Tulasnella sp. 418]|nr:hypothetical protein FRC02_011507 [Tulasnella sp. 418]